MMVFLNYLFSHDSISILQLSYLFAQLQALIMQYFQHNDWIEKHRIADFLLAAQITTFVLEHYCSYISANSISPIIFVIYYLLMRTGIYDNSERIIK